MKDFVVVSLFDGISIAMSSLNRLGIYPTKYYASEVDSYAISISKYNFPDIIRLGDVTKITGDEIKEPVDLLIGGSPCQGFSFAGNMLQFQDPRSKLFFEYVRLLKILKPKYFLLENVKMPKQSSDVISEMLNADYVELNSHLLSAQNRRRYYWSNLKITQPKPQGLLLKDIIQDGEVGYNYTNEPNFMERYNSEATGIGANQQQIGNIYEKGGQSGVVYSVDNSSPPLMADIGNKPPIIQTDAKPQKLMNVNPSGKGMNGWVYSTNGASPTVTTNKGEGSKIYVGNEHVVAGQPQAVDKNYKKKGKKREEHIEWRTDGKSNTLLPNPKKNLLKNTTYKVDDKYYLNEKQKSLVSDPIRLKKKYTAIDGNKSLPVKSDLGRYNGTHVTGQRLLSNKSNIRRVTPIEAERLQTLPDNHTALGIDKNGKQVKISDSRRYFVLGNGFTCDIISWILSPLLKDNQEMNNTYSKQLGLF
tara:strand:+ start:609 stop:2030 length:1422 start_codon:yes stop_codon:yes gene_type:complete